uniref:Putative lipid phosphate phosphatase n=1 Tax=Anopheles marajoara TaxID=58244 RepID=A0A2M4BRP5_9DIPT
MTAVGKPMAPSFTASGAGTVSKKRNAVSPDLNLTLETIVRIALTCIYIGLEFREPFVRKVQPEELWLYRNPRTESYVPLTMLWPVVLGVPGLVFTLYYLQTRDRQDLRCTVLAFTLGLGLNGVITNTIKLAVGRPRPDFFWRCFPDGVVNEALHCTGTDARALADGRKSFPSGHSSFAFVGLGFLTWYLIGKLHLMNERGRGRSVRVIAAGLPSFVALLIAISRTCDYHHHWQDVTVGSLIGVALSYVCYRQYYPAFTERNCHLPYLWQSMVAVTGPQQLSPSHTSPHHRSLAAMKRTNQQHPSSTATGSTDSPMRTLLLSNQSHDSALQRNGDGVGGDESDSETQRLLSSGVASAPPDQKEAKWI